MARGEVRWSDDIDKVITGDITAAVAYVTPAGGAVVTAVAPCGIERRDEGIVGFTTSLAFGKKLERIVSDPHVALAYHAREHGFSTSRAFVLAQGIATVDITPSPERLAALIPQVAHYLGEPKRGPVWDRLLREYYQERVLVDIGVERILSWPGLDCSGEPALIGPARPGPPAPQAPPKNGAGPRVDVAKAAGRIATLPHRVLAYRGGDGFPVVVAVEIAGHDEKGLRLLAADGLLPPGGRRAGLLTHAYRPHLIGLSTRVFTGWLDVPAEGTAIYAPHTVRGLVAPPRKNLLLVSNGLLAKYGLWQARRSGTAEKLEHLAAQRPAAHPGPRQP